MGDHSHLERVLDTHHPTVTLSRLAKPFRRLQKLASNRKPSLIAACPRLANRERCFRDSVGRRKAWSRLVDSEEDSSRLLSGL